MFRPLTLLCKYGDDNPTRWRAFTVLGYYEGGTNGRVILPTCRRGYLPPEQWTETADGWTLRPGDAIYPGNLPDGSELTGNLRRVLPAVRYVSGVAYLADCGTMGNVEGRLEP